jgi:hypothetical protein
VIYIYFPGKEILKARIFFQLWVARLFILFTKTAAESIGCPQNKPGNKRTKL